MIDRYKPWQVVLIYIAVIIFLTFILLPFFEMFMASLRPAGASVPQPLPVLVG